jgi:hypothetical protein
VMSSRNRRLAATFFACAALALAAAPALAVQPTVERETRHRETPFVDCPGFATVGIWDISRKLTYFYNSDGLAIRDRDEIEFDGRIVNVETGAWVPDHGSRTFFDTLAPDGSFLETYMIVVRKSDYVHQAGRVDLQTGEFNGHEGFGPGDIAALCEALGA